MTNTNSNTAGASLRILHVLHHSVPYLDGYGIRSKSIIDFQRALGLEPAALTSAHHEKEVGLPRPEPTLIERYDGSQYHRTPWPRGRLAAARLNMPFFRERLLMRLLRTSLNRLLDGQSYDVMHAHSPVLCGIPAGRVAARRRIPLVYEVRAFWEDSLLEARQTLATRGKYAYSRGLETRLMNRADAIVVISRHMLDDIAARGIPRERLFEVPNGVDAKRFAARPRDDQLAAKLVSGAGPILGFIGSFYGFEGIDCLVRAMPAILSEVPTARLVLVGTGDSAEEIRALIRELDLGRAVVMTGRVPHEEILRYYSILDVLVYPRHRERVTELVTPLKPLEAMAMGKAVVGSDVGGIMEVLDDGRAGAIFRAGEPAHLAASVVPLLQNEMLRRELGAAGARYVNRCRRWDVIAERYLEVYQHVLAGTERT